MSRFERKPNLEELEARPRSHHAKQRPAHRHRPIGSVRFGLSEEFRRREIMATRMYDDRFGRPIKSPTRLSRSSQWYHHLPLNATPHPKRRRHSTPRRSSAPARARCNRITISNIPPDVSAEQVRDAMQSLIGPVTAVRLSGGVADIEFLHWDGWRAFREFDGRTVDNL
ncbi:hypothetical protein EHS25_002747 [Saitozyma podzolica]|uniref:RRM domain-containing protein n=1 Tax=Saitozyma podzolica TaxID=1890683 RepID=A0A427YD46_9TREE|nr:hypothetical protein EHS25_002747 [Saitozyma podzolica]